VTNPANTLAKTDFANSLLMVLLTLSGMPHRTPGTSMLVERLRYGNCFT